MFFFYYCIVISVIIIIAIVNMILLFGLLSKFVIIILLLSYYFFIHLFVYELIVDTMKILFIDLIEALAESLKNNADTKKKFDECKSKMKKSKTLSSATCIRLVLQAIKLHCCGSMTDCNQGILSTSNDGNEDKDNYKKKKIAKIKTKRKLCPIRYQGTISFYLLAKLNLMKLGKWIESSKLFSKNYFSLLEKGQQPCYKVFETEHAVALLDAFPTVKGHCLLIPKVTGKATSMDLTESEAASYLSQLPKLCRIVQVLFLKNKTDFFLLFERDNIKGIVPSTTRISDKEAAEILAAMKPFIDQETKKKALL
ncbi:hypothetical protein RFI_18459 [Reticulomyxa filosa]|uniref:HIT domain-containing protein n=1 Tax=Reticulomyxa filosa TaxID=46433 RepID=X6MZ70_RETFI|nr:hypothetical protein RFI_18459 [Reticulomyxa filosa]|eukprot:ETO18789.1 hypothetical protein RFI_18459 [Reticulomyxa filosa]